MALNRVPAVTGLFRNGKPGGPLSPLGLFSTPGR